MNKGSRLVMNLFFILFFLLISILLYATISFFAVGNADSTEKIGLILKGGRYDSGWDEANATGAKEAEEALGFRLIIKDNVEEKEEPLINAVNKLISDGCTAIIFSSYGYETIMEKYADDYADKVFYFNAPTRDHKNYISYSGRLYQARYLAGLLAGKSSVTNHIGYVAAMPNGEVIQGINAFTLGCRRANQHAEVEVIYTGSWSDRDAEIEAANKLLKEYDIDVLTVHQNNNYAASVARDNGIKYISCHIPTGEDCELTCVYTDWGKLYTEILHDFFKGSIERDNGYWLGLEGDFVGIADIHGSVPDYAVKSIEIEKNSILSGIDVFSNNIKDINGIMKCRSGEIIPDLELTNHMDWYIQGVRLRNEEQEG